VCLCVGVRTNDNIYSEETIDNMYNVCTVVISIVCVLMTTCTVCTNTNMLRVAADPRYVDFDIFLSGREMSLAPRRVNYHRLLFDILYGFAWSHYIFSPRHLASKFSLRVSRALTGDDSLLDNHDNNSHML
jgi:hypothetical protein